LWIDAMGREHVPVPNKEGRENAAANAAAWSLTERFETPIEAQRWDDGSRDRMHDFYLTGAGHKIALEVTTLTDGNRVGRDVRWEREAPDGLVVVDGLTGCWTATHEGESEASDAVRELRTHLPTLETLGVARADTRTWQQDWMTPEAGRPPTYEPLRALHSVGIGLISSITEASDALLSDFGGKVQVLRGFGTTRPADRNFPVAVIHEQLRDEALHRSDVEKLLHVEDVTSRHLWLWVEVTEGLAMLRSFKAEGLPELNLEIDGLDGVWLGSSPHPEVVTGYLWQRAIGWDEFSCPRRETLPE
jgi:hypothetical protein